MHKLTGKQCRNARALLKWNVYDLSSHVNGINPKRIESYERGMVHIAEWENNEMVTTFRKEGVTFNADLEVVLKEKKKSTAIAAGSAGEGAHIILDGAGNIISDSTAAILPDTNTPGDEPETKTKG